MLKALGFALLVAAGGVFHALGHLLAGLAVGARLEEFSVGCGPRLASLGPMVLRLFPLWASVRWEGQVEEGHYQLLAPGRRLILTLGGPLGSLAGCLTLLVLLGSGWGRIEAGPLDNVVYGIIPGSPAQAAGLQCADRILTVNGRRWTSLEDFQRTAGSGTSPLLLRVGRGHDTLHLQVHLDPDARVRRIGVKVRPAISYVPLPAAEVLPYAARTTLAVTLAPLQVDRWRGGLLRLPEGGILAGPSGWSDLPAAGWLVGAATANAWLALMFLLPIPGTDGMRMVIQAAQCRGLAVPTSVEERLQDVGVWALGTAYTLVLLFLVATA
jgi:hypothetical protein